MSLICTREVKNESVQLPTAIRMARIQREKMYVPEMLDLILVLDIGLTSYFA